jgi:peptidoglycan/xylan/chitin deacetylase (PgdA/CDA1 family)
MTTSGDIAIGAAALGLAAVVGGTLTYAALSAGSQMFGATIIAGNDPAEVALTYDDGPNDDVTVELLDLLAMHNVRATFFMLGKYVRQRPELVRRVQAAGHLIGNHTQTHPWLAWQTERVIREELQRCNEALEDVLGAPVKYFRPPHGARRPAVFRAARELGLKTVHWNAMAYDWEPIGSAKILENVDRRMVSNQNRGEGTNILLHDGGDQAIGADRSDTVAVTAKLLRRWAQDGGTKIVTVDAWG